MSSLQVQLNILLRQYEFIDFANTRNRTTRHIYVDVLKVELEIFQRLSLSPGVWIFLEIAKPRTIRLPHDDLDSLHLAFFLNHLA